MTTFSTDTFFQVTQTRHETTQGPVELPILYYDTSNILAFFLCDTKKAIETLRGTEFKPGLTLGNRTVIAVSFYEYRRTTVGVYNEVGLALPVLHRDDLAPLRGITDLFGNMDKRKLGFYVLDLPVTTALANAAGRELWGYPKFVTEIGFKLDDSHFRGKVSDPESRELILSMEGKLGIGVSMPPLSPVTYSIKDGKTLRTTINVRGNVKLSYPWGMRLKVGKSQHVMARHLRHLGLEDAQPIALMSTHKFQSRLNEGVSV